MHNTYIIRTYDELIIIASLENENDSHVFVKRPLVVNFSSDEDETSNYAGVSKFFLSKYNVFADNNELTEISKRYIITKYKVSDFVNTWYAQCVIKLQQAEDQTMTLEDFENGYSPFENEEDEEQDDNLIMKGRTLH